MCKGALLPVNGMVLIGRSQGTSSLRKKKYHQKFIITASQAVWYGTNQIS